MKGSDKMFYVGYADVDDYQNRSGGVLVEITDEFGPLVSAGWDHPKLRGFGYIGGPYKTAEEAKRAEELV